MKKKRPSIKDVINLAVEPDVQVRFWSKVIKGDDPDACWGWSAGKSPRGYGCFSIKSSKTWAQRVSYVIHHGPIPEGLLVCHKCDNPPCCNPAHLFAGTNYDNSMDRHRKGRTKCAYGVKVGGAKLTPDKVRDIRNMIKTSGLFQHQIAPLFGVSKMTVSLISQNKIWRHVA